MKLCIGVQAHTHTHTTNRFSHRIDEKHYKSGTESQVLPMLLWCKCWDRQNQINGTCKSSGQTRGRQEGGGGVGEEIKVKFEQTSVHVSQNLIEYLDWLIAVSTVAVAAAAFGNTHTQPYIMYAEPRNALPNNKLTIFFLCGCHAYSYWIQMNSHFGCALCMHTLRLHPFVFAMNKFDYCISKFVLENTMCKYLQLLDVCHGKLWNRCLKNSWSNRLE